MKAQGFIIYPGKLTVVDSFRVGCIGRMDAMSCAAWLRRGRGRCRDGRGQRRPARPR
jgi:hypothetical protein